jgi:Flp pilus assembly protein TadG
MKWLQRWRKEQSQEGQSLVEFAVTLPLVLLLVLGTVDLGMGFKTYIVLTNAAREGVRSITIYPSDEASALSRIYAEATTIGLSDDLLAEEHYTVGFSPDAPYSAGDKVTVTVEHEYELLFGTLVGIPDIPFSASATMVVLYDE